MFHTYVTASSGRKIDVDRAWYLMDKELLAEARRKTLRSFREGTRAAQFECKRLGFPDHDRLHFDRATRRQDVNTVTWAAYCNLHEAKYGEPFEPDHSLSWDT